MCLFLVFFNKIILKHLSETFTENVYSTWDDALGATINKNKDFVYLISLAGDAIVQSC